MEDQTQQEEVAGLTELIKELKTHSKKVCLKDKLKDQNKEDLFRTNFFTEKQEEIRPMTVGYSFSPQR